MIHPSRALLDIFPRVGVGRDEGIISPGTLGKTFTLQYNQGNSSAIAWRVPLNVGPYYYRGRPSTPTATIQDFYPFNSYQGLISEMLHMQQPDTSVEGSSVYSKAKLPAYTPTQMKQFFQYDAPNVIFKNLHRANGFCSLSIEDGTLSSYLAGYVPFIDEHGENMGMDVHQFTAEESRIFNYPKNILENRFINSNVARILVQLSKTPVTYMIQNPTGHVFFDATSTGQLVTTEDAYNIVPPMSNRAPLLIPQLARTGAIPGTPERLLFSTLPTTRWSSGGNLQNTSTPTPSIMLWNLTQSYVPEDPLEGYSIFEAAATILAQAISAAVVKLKSGNIPPFSIPQKYGGGEKYIAVVPTTFMAQGIHDLLDDVFFIGVPLGLLAAVSYPYTSPRLPGAAVRFYPYNPNHTAYVVGSPGVFNFTPYNGEPGLISDLVDFDRLAKEGWHDRNTYWSARAPMGQILFVPRAGVAVQNRVPNQVYWHLESQDTIKIVSGGWRAYVPEAEISVKKKTPTVKKKT